MPNPYSFFGLSVERQHTTTLTDAQIKTLPTTRVLIVPAPGPGRVTVCSAVHGNAERCVLNYATPAGVGYTNRDASPRFRIRLGTTGPWSNYFAHVTMFDTHSSLYLPAFFDANSGGSNADWYDEFDNIPVYLSMVNGALGNLTGGHPSNTLTVTVAYNVYDFSLKQFI